MNLGKRSDKEIEKSVKKKDYTGGYEYLPWLMYMRGGISLLMLVTFGAGIYFSTQEGIFWVGIGAILLSGFIQYMLRRDYTSLKKGLVH